MNKWLSRISKSNHKYNPNGDKVDTVKNESAPSTMSPNISYTKEKKSYIQYHKEEELKHLIKKISDNYGGDDPQFLSDYIDDVINEWSHDLDAAISCFKDISKQKIK